jgi:hypothetical protein
MAGILAAGLENKFKLNTKISTGEAASGFPTHPLFGCRWTLHRLT